MVPNAVLDGWDGWLDVWEDVWVFCAEFPNEKPEVAGAAVELFEPNRKPELAAAGAAPKAVAGLF